MINNGQPLGKSGTKKGRRIRYKNGQVAIPPQHDKLITALRTAGRKW